MMGLLLSCIHKHLCVHASNFDEDLPFPKDSSGWVEPQILWIQATQKLKVEASLLFKSMQPFIEPGFSNCPCSYI